MVGPTFIDYASLNEWETYKFEKHILESILKQYAPKRKFKFLWEKTFDGNVGVTSKPHTRIPYIQHIVQLRRTFCGFIKHWLNHGWSTSTNFIEGGVLIGFTDGNVVILSDYLRSYAVSLYDPSSFEKIASKIMDLSVDRLC